MSIDNLYKLISTEEMKSVFAEKQTYISKINDGYWNSLKIDNTIKFTDGIHGECNVKVIGINYFNNFGDAWFTHDNKLFPNNTFVSQADVNNHFKKIYSDIDLITYGVVVINFKRL
jgi:ASC-1-like (ASCH) protein